MEQAKLSCENCKYRFLVIIAALLASTTVFAQQFLPVKGIVNARDLGGYPVQDGRTVRDSVLLRRPTWPTPQTKTWPSWPPFR